MDTVALAVGIGILIVLEIVDRLEISGLRGRIEVLEGIADDPEECVEKLSVTGQKRTAWD